MKHNDTHWTHSQAGSSGLCNLKGEESNQEQTHPWKSQGCEGDLCAFLCAAGMSWWPRAGIVLLWLLCVCVKPAQYPSGTWLSGNFESFLSLEPSWSHSWWDIPAVGNESCSLPKPMAEQVCFQDHPRMVWAAFCWHFGIALVRAGLFACICPLCGWISSCSVSSCLNLPRFDFGLSVWGSAGEALPWAWGSRAQVHPLLDLLWWSSSCFSKTSPNEFGQSIEVCVETLLRVFPPVFSHPWCKKEWNGFLGSLSCLALALVLLHTPARCRVNECFNGKEQKTTSGLEPGCIKGKLMTDIYVEMSINIFYMLFDWPTGNVFLMETNWIISQPSAFVSPELCLKITLF